ncbi:penicillin-binding transpeptidase domain-containing protein [Yaniella flava]|uniref:Penicillin-binding transpeptidase domain-containing protein n=1 Tax=Yaniella flava TaxID=287930 RepID=A0ABP5GD12_9MICC
MSASSLFTTPQSSDQARSSRRRRATVGLSLVLIGALGLTACGPSADDPTEAAEQFGQQLGSDQFEALQDATLTDESVDPERLAEATAALENYPVTVTLDAASIDENDDDDTTTATAEYTVTWDLTGGSEAAPETESEAESGEDAPDESSEMWSYTTQAMMVWNEENATWIPQLSSDTLVPGLADGGQVAVATDAAERGNIFDSEGQSLATDRPVRKIGIDKTHLRNQLSADDAEPTDAEIEEAVTQSATDLAEALDLEAETFVDRTLNAGELAWVEFIVLRDDGETEIPLDEINEIQGAVANEDTMVLGPTSTFARSLLGTFGQPNAEQIENSDGQLIAGESTGLSGLQRMYNDELAGTDGLTITVDNAEATGEQPTSQPVEFSRDASDGTSITTTLDTRVQELAEQMLDESDVPSGMVAIRPSDGHILAAADGPAETSWPLAMSGAYPPGSTFKMVTALAMLRNGATPESTVTCPETTNIGGTEISNFDGYPTAFLGEITLADAIAQSCNTVFVNQWDEISPQQEHDAATALGLVEEPVVGFDGAFLGSVPTDVDDGQHAAGLFGQGVVEASPLGMATVAASIAAGETVTPVLMSEPSVDPSENENLLGNEPLTEDEAATLAELMSGPVETGTVPILQDVPGAPVLAKTGTAQYVEDGEDLAHTWIMATHGDLAVSLFYTEGEAGAQTNGPVLQGFLTELEGIIPSE